MDPRMRAGLVAGGGAAVAVFLTSFVCFCVSGPFIAAISGASAGMMMARDARYARKAGEAGAIAGLYGGVVVAIAQLFGLMIFVALERDQLVSDMAARGYPYTPSMVWGVSLFLSIVVALVDVGIMAGAGAVVATNAAKRLAASAAPGYAAPPRFAATPPRAVAPHVMPPPQAVPTVVPPPPPSYPPPPSFYGLPDAPATSPPDASSATEKV